MTEAQHDRHRHCGERGLEGEDLCHQRCVATHLAREYVGIGRGRHRRAAGDHCEIYSGQAKPCADRNRDRRHHDQLERAGDKHHGIRVNQLAHAQTRTDDEQAEGEGRTSQRIDEAMRGPGIHAASGLSARPIPHAQMNGFCTMASMMLRQSG